MNNLRGDQPEKLGLDYKSLDAVNPAIVCLHISAYGRDNERKAWPGYDFLMQAEAGPDGADRRARRPAAAVRLLHDRLHDRHDRHRRPAGLPDARADRRARAATWTLSLFDVAMHQLVLSWHLVPQRGRHASRGWPRSAHQSITPVQTVRTKDGWIYVMCMKQKFWEELADRIGHPETGRRTSASPPPAARRKNRAELTQALDEAHEQASTTAEWLEVLTGHMPVGADLRPGAGLRQSVRCRPPAWSAACRIRPKPDFKMLVEPAQDRRRAAGAEGVLAAGRATTKPWGF